MEKTLVVAERSGPVLVLTLDGPASRNALGPDIYPEIRSRILAAEADPGIGAIVIAGAGGYFSSGGNVRALRASATGTLADAMGNTDKLNAMIATIVASPKPVIAAVEGGAAGAGVSLALACDLIVAGNAATFTVAHVRVGLTPDGGVTHFLRSALPRQLVSELCLLGQPVPATRLAQAGIVNQLVTDGDVRRAALELAEGLAHGPRTAIANIKAMIDAAAHNDLATQMNLEANLVNRARFGAEAAEGLSAFLEKRRPDFAAARAER